MRETETPADDPAVSEELLDLIGVSRRADVEVLRPSTEEQVADATSDEIGNVVALTQPVEDFQRIRVDVTARQRMRFARNDPWLNHRLWIVPKAKRKWFNRLDINALASKFVCYHRAHAASVDTRGPDPHCHSLYGHRG